MVECKKTFVLHVDSLDILDELSNEQCALLFKAIRDYNKGKEPEDLDQVTKLVFFPFKKQFERDAVSYEKTIERNRKNGSKGGRPKKKTEKTQSVSEKPNQTQPQNGQYPDGD